VHVQREAGSARVAALVLARLLATGEPISRLAQGAQPDLACLNDMRSETTERDSLALTSPWSLGSRILGLACMGSGLACFRVAALDISGIQHPQQLAPI